MNALKSIKIKNVKGKNEFDLTLENLHPNMINLLVAPNGFGKSTIVQTFNSLKPKSLALKNDDLYQGNPANKPELEVKFIGDNANTYIANNVKNDLSSEYDIKVINSLVVAKSSYSTAGANLKIEPIIIYKRIPDKVDVGYNASDIMNSISCEKRILKNISSFFNSIENLNVILNIKDALLNCSNQVHSIKAINDFLSKIPTVGTSNAIKDAITADSVKLLISKKCINIVYTAISDCSYFSTFNKTDIALSMIQIIKWYKINYSKAHNFLKNLIEYEKYKINKENINERLKCFNTTGREIKARKEGTKLIVKFVDANKMSNGERDVLVFLTELFCYSIGMKKNKGILLVDEVFDYLDGSNLVAAQYFLAKFIEEQRKNGNLIYPLIFTHLDPNVFRNYYFKKMKTHYLLDNSCDAKGSDIVKVIQKRKSGDDNDFASRYLLHYNPENINISDEIRKICGATFPSTTFGFKNFAYKEVIDKYLSGLPYNPILVLVGIRIKVEEIVYNQLPENKKKEFIEIHKTNSKLNLASQYTDVSEVFYILQPVYNDSLHLNDDQGDDAKIKSCSLKLYNIPIKNIIKIIFNF